MTTERQLKRQSADTEKLPIIIPPDEQTRLDEPVMATDQIVHNSRKEPQWFDEPGKIPKEPKAILEKSNLEHSFLDAEQNTSNHRVVMPGTREEAEELTFVLQESGSSWTKAWSGLWKFLKKIVGLGSKPDLQKVDPLNGNEHCFTRVEYVSRWGLVEFGITCPKCDALAAGPGQFKRVWNTADGEAVTCPECKSTLLACPTTEKEEHLLPYSLKLHRFSRKRHQFSPYTSQQAAEIRETLPKRLAKNPFADIMSSNEAIDQAEKAGVVDQSPVTSTGNSFEEEKSA